MLKLLAILRSIFLVFIVGYTVRATPFLTDARTFDEQYARCASALGLLLRAAWIAIAWIAFETAIGWWLAARAGRASRAKLGADVPRGGGEPPFAPPGHR
ncbi:hypothetical protein [Anaeromyxobacter sp. SG64]|uniref:hypothetical protein n=1 Tax=Anaeromyxobacter sp. SG64 TaxID=2925409 RepID=UPI001F5AD0CC|nr:hypothetical protein [Anaeromyxobacter sp. SG64]